MSLNKSEHENHRIPQDAQIAQLVEQRTENPRVAGSIPAGTTIRMMQVYPSPAEGIGLENRQRINVLRGFESLNLRH